MSFLTTIRIPLRALFVSLLLPALYVPAHADDTQRYLVTYELGAKSTVLASLGNAAVIHHEFDDLGLLAVSMPSSQADAVASLSAVINVAADSLYYLSEQTVPYGIDMVNARDEWDTDRNGTVDSGAATGSGLRVCIVDTGIYAAHEDLGAGGVNILAGRSFVGETWFEDRNGHGTHVAGTIAAANNGVGVVGVSPGEVDLIIADVFNDAGDGQASSTILAAANWCADQGANIISMSLGGLQPNESIEAGYRALYNRGILIIAAAGNDGGPVNNYPASYPEVASVAAIDSSEAVADFSNFVPEVEVAAPGVAVLSSYPFENSLAIDGGPKYAANSIANALGAGTYEGVLADGGGCSTVQPAYSGKMVLCERGVPFRVIIDNVEAGGGTGAIIYNNEPGNFSGTYGPVCCAGIPAISLSQADGQDALGYIDSMVTMVVDLESTAGYAEVSGTSMATPHASSTAAVTWSACNDLSNDQVRSHLAAMTRESQADLLPGRDIFYGYGIVQVHEGVVGLSDGTDDYDVNNGDSDGNNPANVECPEDPETADASKAKGGGKLAGATDKIDFHFKIEEKKKGLKGKLKLKDKQSDTRIDIEEVANFAGLTAACGPVPAGNNAIVFEGEGTINSQPASFRVCAADIDKKGKGNDLFYLECTEGCSYDTTAAGANGVLDGGNVKVYQPKDDGKGDADDSTSSGEASVVTLDPVLLSGGVPGELQVFTAYVYDNAQRAMSGATVTLEAISADGTVNKVDAVTGPTGAAVFVRTLGGDVEYRAVANGIESNGVSN